MKYESGQIQLVSYFVQYCMSGPQVYLLLFVLLLIHSLCRQVDIRTHRHHGEQTTTVNDSSVLPPLTLNKRVRQEQEVFLAMILREFENVGSPVHRIRSNLQDARLGFALLYTVYSRILNHHAFVRASRHKAVFQKSTRVGSRAARICTRSRRAKRREFSEVLISQICLARG